MILNENRAKQNKKITDFETSKDLIDYINNNGEDKYLLMDEVIKSFKSGVKDKKKNNKEQYEDDLMDFAMSLENFEDIAVLVMKSKVIRIDVFLKINDNYLKRMILMAIVFDNKENEKAAIRFFNKIGKTIKGRLSSKELVEQLIDEIELYSKIRQEINQCTNEEGKTKLILSLENQYIKLTFLDSETFQTENRWKIISSIKNNISKGIAPEVKLAQKMIWEFCKDNLKENFDEKEHERLYSVFRTTDVIYDRRESSIGACIPSLNTIIVKKINRKNPLNIIQVILHEYGHAISGYNVGRIIFLNKKIEEGTQDIFAQEVLNHYLKKHKKIKIRGEDINASYPVKIVSGYRDFQSWMKTFLYLNEKEGKDKEVLLSYEFNEDKKNLEMIFGKEGAKRFLVRDLGAYFLINKDNLYQLNRYRLTNINEKSQYFKDNKILQEFKRIQEKEQNEESR